MDLTIHRGGREVGGSCVEVSHAQTRMVLDVGLPLFDENREPHDSFRLRRLSLEGLKNEGILPKVEGLFTDDTRPAPDAILLSHAHLDHTGLLDHTRAEIPIYASRGTSKMMLAGSVFARQVPLPRDRFRPLKPSRPVRIGDITVTAFAVDHSIFGAVGFLLEADGESFFYTGDLRLHGLQAIETSRMIHTLRRKQIDTLVVEGTHFGLPTSDERSEREAADEIARLTKDAESLVLACLSPQHTDRLTAFHRAAVDSGRTFAVDLYTAFVMHLAASETDLPRPVPEQGVRVFLPKAITRGGRLKRLVKLIDLLATDPLPITDIIGERERYVAMFRESMLGPDFGGKLPDDSLCIYSRWSGYLEEPEWIPVGAAIDECGGRLATVHSSGHLLEDDIARFVERFGAKRVVPIHTFEPERFESIST